MINNNHNMFKLRVSFNSLNLILKIKIEKLTLFKFFLVQFFPLKLKSIS